MDAKPQRPRVLRIHDENMPPPALPGAAPGKTLHQRTKSTPAFSALFQAGAIKAGNKKILGEVNANIKVTQAAKDDSEVGKASPGKVLTQESLKPAAAGSFTRLAARPLAPKPSNLSMTSAPVATAGKQPAAHMIAAEPEPVKKVVAKKSTKVLKDVQPIAVPEPDNNNKYSFASAVPQSLIVPKEQVQAYAQSRLLYEKPMSNAIPIQHQEVRKTESVPLRDEPAPRPQVKPLGVTVPHLPPGFETEREWLSYLEYQSAQMQATHDMNGVALINEQPHYVVSTQAQIGPYYDVEEEEYGYDDGYYTARSFGLHGESTGGVTTVLAPSYTDKVRAELEAAKEYVETTRSPDDVEDELWDTSMVAEYGEEIFGYMRDLETRMAPNPRYMEQQQEIQWSMRAVLMDWVVQVHQRFNLLPETLFLTVNYIDRFLSCKIVSLGKLQLVGATAIFVAAKYEEVQCPTIAEIIYMVDGGYSADELLKAERFMLSMLQFELGWPGPMSFLRRISKADDYDLETRTLAKYFLEVTIMDERFVGCTPSFLAAAAHCMARLMIHGSKWSPAHVYYSNYTYSQLHQLLAAILECCEDPRKHHSAVYEKYTDKRYKRASTFVESKMAEGFQIPSDATDPVKVPAAAMIGAKTAASSPLDIMRGLLR